jgi:hypothetical protein
VHIEHSRCVNILVGTERSTRENISYCESSHGRGRWLGKVCCQRREVCHFCSDHCMEERATRKEAVVAIAKGKGSYAGVTSGIRPIKLKEATTFKSNLSQSEATIQSKKHLP